MNPKITSFIGYASGAFLFAFAASMAFQAPHQQCAGFLISSIACAIAWGSRLS